MPILYENNSKEIEASLRLKIEAITYVSFMIQKVMKYLYALEYKNIQKQTSNFSHHMNCSRLFLNW